MSRARVFIETYGCSTNRSDSEIMQGILLKDFSIVDSQDDSDLNIINTCVVKTPTENRMRFRIGELTETGKPLVVAGCMSDTERDIIEGINPKASIVGSNSIESIDLAVKKTLDGKRMVALGYGKKSKLEMPKARGNKVVDILQISSGCLGKCAFCQTRFARGRLRSYPLKLVLRSIEDGLRDGVKEFWLTSQDTGCYGMDIGANLPALIKAATEIKGKYFIRVGMMNPIYAKGFLDELIKSYKSNHVFKFLHMPVQSGSDHVLELMGRGYSVRDFDTIATKFRDEFPDMILSTDIIVGFPGETDADFRRSMRLIRYTMPDVVNVSSFGRRPGTAAADMEQLSLETVRRRTKEMSSLVDEVMRKQHERWIGWEGEVLVDEIANGKVAGRNSSFKQVIVDGSLGEFRNGKIYS
jgi:threonylcarbamoyladenosine tRNA methylthiotransferase CDKAL1